MALLSKKNRGETVNISLALRIGNEKDLFGQQLNATMAGSMLARGTTKYSRAELSDLWEKLKVTGRVAGPGANLQTTRPNLEGALVGCRLSDGYTFTIIALIGIALAFDFLNGLHDAANSIATVVATRLLGPVQAVVFAAFFNFHTQHRFTVYTHQNKQGCAVFL